MPAVQIVEGHAAAIMQGSPETSEDQADVINTLQAVCDAGLMSPLNRHGRGW